MPITRPVLIAVLLGLAATLAVAAGAPAELDGLSRAQSGRTKRVSSSDPDWRNGNADARPIQPGETLTIADIEGPGVIRHIWFTISARDPQYGRSLTLRMYWDGEEEPAVESPFGDFFAVGHGVLRQVDSAAVAVSSEGRAYNCYWSMPFARRARITLTNEAKERVRAVYWYVDYEEVPALPPDTLYFHAQYRQEYPTKAGRNYLILDAEGRGHYVGTVLSSYCRSKGWYGEGDDFFFIDGEQEPSLRGTGTEDYFCDAWGFREFNRPYYGVVLFEGYELGDRVTAYRWHIKDPVRFEKSLKVEIENKGVLFDDQGKRISGFENREDLYSSVAFWYQSGRAKRFAQLPPAAERVVPLTLVDLEESREAARPDPSDTKLEIAPSSLFNGEGQLLARFSGDKAKLTIPFRLAKDVTGVARLRLAVSPESGIFSVSLDGRIVDRGADLYASGLGLREVRFGFVRLEAGEHTLVLESIGRNPASRGNAVGLDVISIDHLTEYAPPAK